MTRFYKVLWEFPDEYPLGADLLTDEEWRWEFLRRSTEYYEAWCNANPIPDTEEDDDNYRYVETWEEDFRMGLLLDPSCEYDSPQVENWLFKAKTGNRIFTDKYYPQVYKFSEMMDHQPDPVFGGMPSLQMKLRAAVFPVIHNVLQLPPFTEDWRVAIAAFDMSEPLGPQIANVEAQLEREQRKLGKKPRSPRLKGKDRKLWPLYLRLLDAEGLGLRPMEIFKILEKEGVREIQGADNEASRISGMIEAAFKVQKKIIINL